MSDYASKVSALRKRWAEPDGPVKLEKSTASNLFRYESGNAPAQPLRLGHFNTVISIDEAGQTLEVEGLATFETIVDYCLPRGYLPLVTPELKHITIGGATVGIGIESSGFRHGFVHDGLLEADVLLPGGGILSCTADNEHADLLNGLANSYGTIGYILRARIALMPARPFVRLTIQCFDSPAPYLAAMLGATQQDDVDFVEGLFFADRRFYLMTGRLADRVPELDDILRQDVFYKLVQSRRVIFLTTRDYLFRYDPEWFWNIPDTRFHSFFRRHAPERLRNSAFYTRYAAWKNQLGHWLPGIAPRGSEPLIQDWQVPWIAGVELIEFCLQEVELDGRPLVAVPLRTPKQATLYPMRAGEMYFNLGCYCQVRRPYGREPYYSTKIMDQKCFALGGIKMLYSSTFLDETGFDAHFGGAAYRTLKAKYDPHRNSPTLYDKVAVKQN